MIRQLVKKIIIWAFHFISYRAIKKEKLTWFGVPFIKFPHDLIFYQRIIFETKPDLIIETGTKYGGTTLFLAHMLDVIGKGQIITIELFKDRPRVRHPRIIQLIGSSTDFEIFRKIPNNLRTMVVLDSNHLKKHVLQELELYSPLVSEGCYLIVEDTNIGLFDSWNNKKAANGPLAAIDEFLRARRDFVRDSRIEHHYLTMNHGGILKRM